MQKPCQKLAEWSGSGMSLTQPSRHDAPAKVSYDNKTAWQRIWTPSRGFRPLQKTLLLPNSGGRTRNTCELTHQFTFCNGNIHCLSFRTMQKEVTSFLNLGQLMVCRCSTKLACLYSVLCKLSCCWTATWVVMRIKTKAAHTSGKWLKETEIGRDNGRFWAELQ